MEVVEGAATAAIEVLVQNLINVSKEEISLIRGLQKNADKLRETLGMMQSLMNDAQSKFVTEEAVKRWLKQLEEASFEADNVLDELNYQLLSKKMKKIIREKKKIPSCFPSFSQYARRRQMALRVKEINTNFESINDKATKLGLERRLADAPVVQHDAAPETNSFTLDPIFIGRDDDVSRIVEMLTTCQTEQVLSVLPIVGMGGLGKTTLTRNVFRDQSIKTHFGERIWVHVPKVLDPVSLLKEVLTNLTSKKVDVESSQAILKKLQEALKEKTFLLVLDDVWNEDRSKWKYFKNSISGICSKKGNSIIVTTRNTEVASIAHTLPIYELGGLLVDTCWSIIKAKAFGEGDAPPGYETIGRDIARRCQGLPLAANVVGSVLCGKSDDDWRSIKENWLSGVEDGENNITKILKLSYLHLSSPSLKKCFAYCSVYGKGKKIYEDILIELWMAEGFLQPDDRSDMETVGKKFLNLLLQNSLIQVAERDGYGNITHCSMHDLVHDLAYSVLGRDYYEHESGVVSKEKAKHLRTLFYQGDISDIIFSDFKSLHVLTLSEGDVEELPSSIKELTHLRYLNVTYRSMDSLPDSIGQLYHLQTLRAYPRKLPSTLKYLVNLRHLHIDDDTELPAEVGMLTSLQTLEHFKVGKEKGHQIVELGSLHNLKGKLEIHNLEKVDGEEEAKKACLFKKPNLIKIVLRWNESREGEKNDENVLDGLQPHPNLKMLEIIGFKGATFPSWTLKMAVRDVAKGLCVGLHNLMEIKLSICSECEEIPMMGHLPYLRALFLSGMSNLKTIGSSFYGIDELCGSSRNGVGEESITLFPALKQIVLSNMENLTEWVKPEIPSAAESREVKVFPSLECLKITKCPKLVSAPVYELPCLEELVIDECDELLCLPTLSFHINQNLSKLSIKKCPKLRELPDGLHTPTSLENLAIEECPYLEYLDTSLPLADTSGIILRSLTKIKISGLEGLVSLPNWLFTNSPNLTQLVIKKIHKLRELPDVLHTLTSLEILTIAECPYLEYLPLADTSGIKLTSLTKIEISGLMGLVSLPNWLFTNNPNLTRLVIKRCHKLRELPDDLYTLTSLENLTIAECPYLEYLDTSLPLADTSGIKLTSLTKIEISGLKGLVSLPNWLFTNCPNLTRLWIEKCSKLRGLPDGLFTLTSLEALTIKECPYIRELDTGLPFANTYVTKFRSLKYISFWVLKRLVCLPNWLYSNSPNLESLDIFDCPKLRELPDGLHTLTSLKRMSIEWCGNIKSIPYDSSSGQGGLKSLRQLSIKRCESLVSFPCEILESCSLSLEELSLGYLDSLMNLPSIIDSLHKMPHLRILKIMSLPKLIMSSSCTLTSLQRLTLSVADSDSWENFNSTVGRILHAASESSLESVYLTGMEDWDSLPDQIQHLAALGDLTISDFGIQELPEWFVNFTSLRELSLSFCRKLRRLPPAEVLSRLTKLEINECPLLKESCGIEQVSSGRHHSEWPNISHIPNIKVDFRQIRSDGRTAEEFRYLDEAAAEH